MKALKRFGLWSFVVPLVAVGGLFFYGGFLSGRTVQSLPDTNGTTTAYVRNYSGLGATDTDMTSVELRARRSPLRHTVLSGLNYGAHVRIEWTGTDQLLVQCSDCANLAVYKCEGGWNKVYVRYDFEDGLPLYPVNTFGKSARCPNDWR